MSDENVCQSEGTALEELRLRTANLLDPDKITVNDFLIQEYGGQALSDPGITAREALAIAKKCRMPGLKFKAFGKAINLASYMTGAGGCLYFINKLLDELQASKYDLTAVASQSRRFSGMLSVIVQLEVFDKADELDNIILAINAYKKVLIMAPELTKQVATPLAETFAKGTTAAFLLGHDR